MAIRFVDQEEIPKSKVTFVDDAPIGAPSQQREKVFAKYPALRRAFLAGTGQYSKAFSEQGGDIAEWLGEKFPENPNIGATAGTAYSMIPDIVSSATGISGMRTSPAPLAKAIRQTPEMMGPEFEAGKRAAGISEELPIRRGSFARFPQPSLQKIPKQVFQEPFVVKPPASYPKDPSSFVNFANARIKSLGSRLSPQELNDYKAIIDQMFRGGEIPQGTTLSSASTGLRKVVTKLHGAAIPGRENLNEAYKLSRSIRLRGQREAISSFVRKHGPKALFYALGGAGAGAIGGSIIKRSMQP